MHDTFVLRRFRGVRRAAAVAAAVLGLALAAPAAPAAPQPGVCSVGEFCMWSGNRMTAGLYHWHGSDANLWNDRFEFRDGSLDGIVADGSRSFWNRGTSAGPAQVRVYIGINGTGAFTCAPQGSSGDFGFDRVTGTNFLVNVESFAWRSFC
jgi:peptidase inhibitor family I36